jgi:hypothetical protein
MRLNVIVNGCDKKFNVIYCALCCGGIRLLYRRFRSSSVVDPIMPILNNQSDSLLQGQCGLLFCIFQRFS